MHFKFEPQEAVAFSFGSPSKSPAPTFVFGIPHPKKHQNTQQPTKAGTCAHSVATANSHKLLEMNNNLERDRDGWKATAQAKQTEVEIRGLKASEWKAKAHAKQAEAEMWKKKYERALGRNTTGNAGFNKTAERKICKRARRRPHKKKITANGMKIAPWETPKQETLPRCAARKRPPEDFGANSKKQ